MKNKMVGFFVIIFFFWIFAKDDKPQTNSTEPIPESNSPYPLLSQVSIQDLAPKGKEEEAKTLYINADTLKVRSTPNGNAIESLKRGTQVKVYEQRSSWNRISTVSEQERWVHSNYLCETDECYTKKTISQPASPPKQKQTEQPSAPKYSRSQPRSYYGSSCPCSSNNICIGPRGGRYCITSGGNKRYGV